MGRSGIWRYRPQNRYLKTELVVARGVIEVVLEIAAKIGPLRVAELVGELLDRLPRAKEPAGCGHAGVVYPHTRGTAEFAAALALQLAEGNPKQERGGAAVVAGLRGQGVPRFLARNGIGASGHGDERLLTG